MDAQIVFLTLFLGIVSGFQPIALQVSGPVKTVRMMLGGREVAVLTQPPWRATVDFGAELAPRELTVIGFDGRGEEVARATQVLNVPRPTAELDIVLDRSGSAAPTGATLRWQHLMNAAPKASTLTLDGKALTLDSKLHARLPKIDMDTPHVLSAQIRFDDSFIARRELVIESFRSDSVGTQLTPIAVRETAPRHPAAWDGCLAAGNRPVRTAAVESPRALVIVVREPDEREASSLFDLANRSSRAKGESLRHYMALDKGTVQRMMWPIGERYDNPQSPALLFPPSMDFDATDTGLLRFLTLPGPPDDGKLLRFADAVAVAGIRAATGAQRRAVIYVLSRQKDASRNSPSEVRRYLASLGVPLFVWSLNGARPDLASTWGEVDDVTSLTRLGAAESRVRKALKEQRIAWVDADPLTALHLQAKPECGIETLARSNP